MARLCAEAGLPAPEFREEQGQFIQILRRPQRPDLSMDARNSDKVLWDHALSDLGRAFPGATAQVTAQVAIFCQRPRAAREIMEHLNLHHWKTFQTNYLIPRIKNGLLERTIPDKPTSRLQKYRLTEKGRAWLAGERS